MDPFAGKHRAAVWPVRLPVRDSRTVCGPHQHPLVLPCKQSRRSHDHFDLVPRCAYTGPPIVVQANDPLAVIATRPAWYASTHEGLLPGENKIAVGEAVPLDRMGTPAEIVGAAVPFAGDKAVYDRR